MSTDAAATRHRLRIEELCGATIRALTSRSAVHFRGGRLYDGQFPVRTDASHVHPDADDGFTAFRGAADGIALRLMHSDPALHESLSPAEELPNAIFEMLEQFRVESLVDPSLRGAVKNLRYTHETWSRRFAESGLTETELGLVLYTVAQICRSRVTGEPVVEATEDLLESTRFMLSPLIGHELAGLRGRRHVQSAYAALAVAIATRIADLVAAETDGLPPSTRAPLLPRTSFSLAVSQIEGSVVEVPAAGAGESAAFAHGDGGYHVFTRSYDREVAMIELSRAQQLTELRQRLDDRVTHSRINVRRLSRQLRLVLTEPHRHGWDAAQDEGVIDGRSLTRLITSAADRRLFQTERIEPVSDCVVTVLLDCSGSMRRHQEATAVVLDVLGRALDLADVSSELLAFTTGAWNGGRAMRDWRRSGRQRHPGRLNERLHIVLKDADEPWRAARPAVANLLRQDIYRESIDGEAVEWACRRLRERTETHKILIVVSDGSPMDGATTLTNDAEYLGAHLRRVVDTENDRGEVWIAGLGVSLDLSPYYARSRVIDVDDGVTARTFDTILDLLTTARSARA